MLVFRAAKKTKFLYPYPLAFGRRFYMNEAQMLDAAECLWIRFLLPCHWDIWREFTGNALELGRLVERLKMSFDVELLLIGDYLHYHKDGRYRRGI